MSKRVTDFLYSIDVIFFIAVLIAGGFFLYVKSVLNGFVYDDYFIIVGNRAIQSGHGIIDFFTNNKLAWATQSDSGIYRPFYIWQLSLFYKLFGLDPFYYHIVSVFIHVGNAVLLFVLGKLLLHDKVISFFVALCFLIHPLNTEAVAWITAQNNLFATAYSLTALIGLTLFSRGRSLWWYVASCILVGLAMLTREQFVTLPAILLLFLWLACNNSFKKSMVLSAPYWLMTGVYFLSRLLVGATIDQGVLLDDGKYVSFFTAIKALAYYMKLVFVPYPLTVNYDSFPNYFFPDYYFVLAVSVLMGLGVLALYYKDKAPLFSWGIIAFYIYLSPISNILFHVNAVLDERFTYFGLSGFLLGLGAVIIYIRERVQIPAYVMGLVYAVTCACVLVFSMLTIVRIGDWKDSLTLWTSALEVNNLSFRNYINVAVSIGIAEGPEMAIPFYRKALVVARHNMTWRGAGDRMSYMYSLSGQYDKAMMVIDLFEKREGKRYYDMELRRALVFWEAKKYKEARSLFAELLSRKRDEKVIFYYTLAGILSQDERALVEDEEYSIANDYMREHVHEIAEGKRALDNGNTTGAIQILLPIISRESLVFYEPYLWLGEAFEREGNDMAALGMYQAAAYMNFALFEAQYGIERILRREYAE